MDLTDLSKPMPDEKSRAYRVPVDPAWFQERDCVVIETDKGRRIQAVGEPVSNV